MRVSGISVCGYAGEASLDGRSLRWASEEGPAAATLDLDLRDSTVRLRLCPMGRAVMTIAGANIFGAPQLSFSKGSKDLAQPTHTHAEVRAEFYAKVRRAQSDRLFEAAQWNAGACPLLACNDDVLRTIVRFCCDHDMLAVALTSTRMRKAARASRPALSCRRSFQSLFRSSPTLATLHYGISTGVRCADKPGPLFLAAVKTGSLELLRELHAHAGGWWGRALSRRLRAAIDARLRARRLCSASAAAVRAWIAERDRSLLARRKKVVAERRRLWEAKLAGERARAAALAEEARREELAAVVQKQLPGWGMVNARLLYQAWCTEAEALRAERQAAFARQLATT